MLRTPIGITSSAIGIAAEIKKYKSINKKKKHDRIVLLGKSKLNSREVLISHSLIDSIISHYEFAFTNNVVREYDKMKEEINNLKT